MVLFVIFKSYLVENEGVENFALRAHLPLKQGLRHDFAVLQKNCVPLRDHLPLKQGLRRLTIDFFTPKDTFSETIFHYNKD